MMYDREILDSFSGERGRYSGSRGGFLGVLGFFISNATGLLCEKLRTYLLFCLYKVLF